MQSLRESVSRLKNRVKVNDGFRDFFSFSNQVSNWLAIALILFISYFILIYFIYFLFKVLLSLIDSYFFIRWASGQRLVLIHGGPSSGKKLLLTYMSRRMRNRGVTSDCSINYFNSNKSISLGKDNKAKVSRKYFSSGLVSNRKPVKHYFFISEIEDNPLNIKDYLDERNSQGSKLETILKILNGSYSNDRFWLSFSFKGGFLWNILSSRRSSVIQCNGVEKISFKYFKFYFLNLLVKENDKDFKKYRILISERTFSQCRNLWMENLLQNVKSVQLKPINKKLSS